MTDEDLIRDLQRKWFRATMSGDDADIGDLMTDDVVFLTPGRTSFGRQEFIESFKAMKEHVTMNCDGEYIEIIVVGDLAYATAHLDITVTPKNGGDAKQLSGNTMSVFRHRQMGNGVFPGMQTYSHQNQNDMALSKNEFESNIGFVEGGYHRAIKGIEATIRPKVEGKYAEEWRKLGLVKRWILKRRIERKISEQVAQASKHISQDSLSCESGVRLLDRIV